MVASLRWVEVQLGGVLDLSVFGIVGLEAGPVLT